VVLVSSSSITDLKLPAVAHAGGCRVAQAAAAGAACGGSLEVEDLLAAVVLVGGAAEIDAGGRFAADLG
jgi:hypothetical protein